MSTVGLIAGVVALAWSYSIAWMLGVALVRRARRARRSELAPPAGRWLLVRPCAGTEPDLLASLTSVRDRADSLDLDIVFGVSAASDPAMPVAVRASAILRAEGLAARVEVVPPIGPNRKASTLAGVLARHLDGHAGVINIDSNVDMTGIDLGRLVAPLSRARTGATWMPPAESPGATLGDRASRAVLAGSFHAFGLLASIDPEGLVGKAFALRRDAVGAIGQTDLAEFLGEDVEISARLRRDGFDVEAVTTCARARPNGGRFADTVARHARWIAVVRAQRPALLVTYPLLFAPTPLILTLAAVASTHSGWLAVSSAIAGVAARLAASAAARFVSGLRWNPADGFIDTLLADVVLWSAFIRGLASREVEWRGRRLRIDRLGRLHAA